MTENEQKLSKKDKDFYAKIGKKGSDSYLAKPKEERKPRGFAARPELAKQAQKKSLKVRNEKKEMKCLVCGHEHDKYCDCCDESDFYEEES